jgi:sulfoxide reductase heme-binding subunit YedZ
MRATGYPQVEDAAVRYVLQPPPESEMLAIYARARMTDRAVRVVLKPLVFAASLAPAAYWIWVGFANPLHLIPFNAIVRDTGFWSLRFLCVTVTLTPLRWLTGWHWLVKFRRMLGLFAFVYGATHLAAYVAFDALRGDAALTLSAMATDLPRPFFAIGYVSFVLMAPLAATSTVGMIRRLGGPRWQALHRLVYPAAIAGVVHTYWPWTTHSPRWAVILSLVFAVRIAVGYTRGPRKRSTVDEHV